MKASGPVEMPMGFPQATDTLAPRTATTIRASHRGFFIIAKLDLVEVFTAKCE